MTDLTAWGNSSVFSGDLLEVVAKQKSVRDVIVAGSASVVHTLAEQNLVDEFRILVFPELVGRRYQRCSPPRQLPAGYDRSAPRPSVRLFLRYEREVL